MHKTKWNTICEKYLHARLVEGKLNQEATVRGHFWRICLQISRKYRAESPHLLKKGKQKSPSNPLQMAKIS